MKKLMTVFAVAAAALLVGCTGSNPIQRELGYTSELQLTNESSEALNFELVAGTTPSEVSKGDIVATVTLGPGETVDLATYPGRYTLFPRNADPFAGRSLAFQGVTIGADSTEKVVVSEAIVRTFNGDAKQLVFNHS